MVIHVTAKPESTMRRAIVLSFIVAIVMVVLKFLAYILTGSAAILSDAAESIVNIFAAGFALFSLIVSFRPPDSRHPYGHGKVEFISAAFEGGAIVIAALWIIYNAVQELITGPTFHKLDIGIWLVLASVVVNTALGAYLVIIGKKAGSMIIEADGRHVLTDAITSIGVVVGLIVLYFTDLYFLDSVIAIIVALSIIRTGVRLLKKAGGGMMDATTPEEEAKIRKIIDAHYSQDVCGYHKIRLRHSGKMCFVDFHLILPKEMPIGKGHEVATRIESTIATALEDAGVMAHIEPCTKHDCPKCSKRT